MQGLVLTLAVAAATGAQAVPPSHFLVPPELARRKADELEQMLDRIDRYSSGLPENRRADEMTRALRQKVADLRAGRPIARSTGPLPPLPPPAAQLRKNVIERLIAGYARQLAVNDRVLDQLTANGGDAATLDFLRKESKRLRAEIERLQGGDLTPVMPVEPRGGTPKPARRID